MTKSGGLHRRCPRDRGQGPGELRDGDVPKLYLCVGLPNVETSNVCRGGASEGQTEINVFTLNYIF